MFDSVLKGLKDAVWEDDTKKPVPAAAKVEPISTSTTTFGSWPPGGAGVTTTSVTTTVDQKDVEALRKILPASSSNASEAFERSVRSLAPIIPDEDTRVKAAITMLTAQGISLQAITADYELQLGDIDNHLTQFNSARAKAITAEVDGPLKEAAELSKQIEAAERSIAQMRAQKDVFDDRARDAQDGIDKRTATLTGAADALRAEIRERISKLKSRI